MLDIAVQEVKLRTPTFERVIVVGIPVDDGPDSFTFDLNLPDVGKFKIEGWQGSCWTSNVHVIRGRLTLAQCQSNLMRGQEDFLFTIPMGGASGGVWLPDSVTAITVFYEAKNTNSQNQYQVATIRVSERR
jgi:hypothetical protein